MTKQKKAVGLTIEEILVAYKIGKISLDEAQLLLSKLITL